MVEKRPKTFKGSKPAVKKTETKKTVIKKAPAKKTVKKTPPKKTSPVIEKTELVSISIQTVEEPISDSSVLEEMRDQESAPNGSGPSEAEKEQESIESESGVETTSESENVSSTEKSSGDEPPTEDTSISSEKALSETSSVPPFTPHFENSQDEEPVPKKRRVLLIVGVFVALLLLIILAIFGYLYVSKKSSIPFFGNDVVHVKHVPVSPTVQTPTPTKEVDRTAYDIEVLNGSGKSGEAGKVKSLLTGENFIVSDTGNANRYTYTETVIEAKKTVNKDFLKELRAVLSQNYSVASTSSLLESSSSVDVVVTVGRD